MTRMWRSSASRAPQGGAGVTRYSGQDIALGGSLDGTCGLDVTLTATPGGGTCELSYAGTICEVPGLEPLGTTCPVGL